MERNSRAYARTGETATGGQGWRKSTGFENLKNIIADKLHYGAEVLGEEALKQNPQSGIAQQGKQASEWLDKSAEYVRQFDYEEADASVREYVGRSPGRSLLIAGGVGLIIGAILRRR